MGSLEDTIQPVSAEEQEHRRRERCALCWLVPGCWFPPLAVMKVSVWDEVG